MAQIFESLHFSIGNSPQPSAAFLNADLELVIAGNDFGKSPGVAFAMKCHLEGNLIWENNYAGQFITIFKDMTQLIDGTYMAVGTYFTSDSAGDENIWIVNIDNNGKKVWEKQIGSPQVQSDGLAIIASPDGGFAIAAMIFKEHLESTLVMKFGKDKSIEWEITQKGFMCFSIAPALKDAFILSGRVADKNFNCHPVALIVDAQGTVKLNKIFSEISSYGVLSTDSIQTADGNFLMVFKNIILKFSSKGDLIWTRLTKHGNFKSVVERKNGDLVIAGAIIVHNYDQAYVAVTDNGGDNIIWDNTELTTPSSFSNLFLDPRDGGVVWAVGNVPNGQGFEIIGAAFNPVKALSDN